MMDPGNEAKPLGNNDFMPGPLRVLIVEDSVDDTLLIAAELQRGGLDPVYERVETAAAMQAALDVHEWGLIICDYSMPQLTGPVALAIFCQKGLDIRSSASPAPSARKPWQK